MTLGKTGQVVVYINDTEYDSYDYRCMKVLNGVHTFDIGTLVIADATDRANITEGNKVKITVGEDVFFTGVIEESGLGSYGEGKVSGIDTVMYRLKRRTVPQNVANVSYYEGKDLDYIIPRIISVNNDGSSPWIVTEGTVDTFGTNSLYVRGDNDNKANFLIKAVEPTYYDFYPSYGSDPYNSEIINVVTEKGGGVSKYTFDLDDNTSNVSVMNDKKQVDRMWNVITLAGYGDGINQIKSKIFHATVNRTTLDEDITVSDTGSKLVVDSSDLPASGNVWIGCEKVAYSAKADDTHITISTRGVAFFTGAGFPQEAYAHKKGSPVYDAQYTETSAQTGSSIDTYNGVVDKSLSEKSIIDQNTLDMTVSAILEEHKTTPRSIVLGIPDISDLYGLSEITDLGQPGSGSAIYAFCYYSDVIYAGISTYHVYKYVSGSWIDAGTPLASNTIYSMTEYNGEIYCGLYTSGDVYRYDSGTTWTNINYSGIGNEIQTLQSYNGKLYAGNNAPSYLYSYNGTSWAQETGYTGVNATTPTSMEVHDEKLYVGSDGNGHCWELNGTTWNDRGQVGSATKVTSLASHDGKLYAGTNDAHKVYRYDGGTTWTNVGALPISHDVDELASYNDELYGGSRLNSYFYIWDGSTTWESVDSVGANILDMSTFDEALHISAGGHIYKYSLKMDIGDNVTVNSTDDGISNEVFKIQAIELSMSMGLEKNKLYLSSYSPRLEQRVKSIEESTEIVSKYMQGSTILFPVQNYENCGSGKYLDMRFYLPSEVIAINTVKLSFKLEDYRAYTTTSASGGSSTPTTAGGSVGTGNDKAFEYILANTDSRSFAVTVPSVEYGSFIAHNFFMWYYDAGTEDTHYIKLYDATTATNLVTGTFTQDGYEGNWVSTYLTTTNRIGNTMSYIVDNTGGNTGPRAGDEMELEIVTYGSHTHTVTIAAHTHAMGYTITTQALTSPSVDVYIGEDGGSMTLKGTYTTNQSNLDVTSLVKDVGVGKWINVQFRPNKNMRIEANAYTQAFINSD